MSEVKRKRGRPRKTNIVNNTDLPDGTAKEIVSTKKKRNRSDLSNYGQEFIEAGDNTKFITFAMESRRLPKLNFEDIPAVQERINWYFTRCAEQDMKPGVVGLANALGIDRRTLWSWKTGERRAENKELADTIKQAYSFLEEMWEMYMQNGKIAPPNGIFLGKNHFGYVDVQDVVVQPQNPYNDDNPNDVRNKYLEGIPNEIHSDGKVE